MSRIIYTKTDESPALASHSLLPIFKAFAKTANIELEVCDISLAGRIIAAFPDYLDENQKIPDGLGFLGEFVKKEEANIIKLPNISASVPQLLAAVKELQTKGYKLPDYPENPQNAEQEEIKKRYDKIKGSAVNPVIREGNSDRRSAKAVKNYAKQNPHSMGEWNKNSAAQVFTMQEGDFLHNEKSLTMDKECEIRIVLKNENGETELKKLKLLEGEIIDATVMEKAKLEAYYEAGIKEAKAKNLLLSLHLKGTMMKVSDPIIFGVGLKTYFAEVYKKYGDKLPNPNNGLSAILAEVKDEEVINLINETIKNNPIAMVDSEKGITNFNVPSDVIIDASMAAMLRAGGKMYNSKGELQDSLALIPDSSYADIYQAVIDYCRENGALNPATLGTVPNVGLMAKKAEEYGSHDKTFEIKENGEVLVICEGKTLINHKVQKGDIWRMCQSKDEAIIDWVNLAVRRAKLSKTPAVFWLSEKRAHDRELLKKVKRELAKLDLNGVDIQILEPYEACQLSLKTISAGKDIISATGNVLRDYLTDLFPILELGSSSKMLSIVPLMNGGGLFETGAGGSAPKQTQQFLEENHLRWDSLGEFLAFGVSLEHLALRENNKKAEFLAQSLDKAVEKILLEDRSPKREVGQLDNRGSHFYLALYWAESLANCEDAQIKAKFAKVYESLKSNEQAIINDLIQVQGHKTDIGGYYLPNSDLVKQLMRPSKAFNEIIDKI